MIGSPESISEICSEVLLRGTRIVRQSEKRLDRVQFDGNCLEQLGEAQIGVLINGENHIAKHIDWVCELAEINIEGTVVVVAATNTLAATCFQQLSGTTTVRRPKVWRKGSVVLTTPESLKETAIDAPVVAVVLLDPQGNVHKARGWEGRHRNDRPSHIVRFRQKHHRGDWQPPLVVVTAPPAKSLNTEQMLGPFGLETWWYVDGRTLGVGPLE